MDDANPGVYVNCDVLLDIVDDAMQYIVDQGLPPHDVYKFLLFYICSIQMLTNKDTGKIFLMYVLISINYWLVCFAFLVNLVVVICFCLFYLFLRKIYFAIVNKTIPFINDRRFPVHSSFYQ